MLVQAREINYDYVNHRVAAVGNVQIYYGGSTLQADRVIYDQATKRLHAEGNVQLREEDGKVTYGTIMDLSDDYRDGFVDSLRLDTPDQTRMAAARAERTSGNFTVMHNGVYTACAPCKDDPKKPPLWQVKAVRIIHDQGEKMLYFEDARLEFFGAPLAWLPYFSAPDPTVKRKTGMLMPTINSSSNYGLAVEVPYYWALAPDYDATFEPMITTKQGLLLQGEFRQRLIDGAYSIRAAGIHQSEPSYFVHNDGSPTPGYRDWRGSLESEGQFALNSRWTWGWDALMLSDKTFLQDYNPHLSSYHVVNPLQTGITEGVSQIYLTGKGNRSYFDVRSIYYLGFSEADVQNQIPVIHPVIDYTYTFDHPVLGGELGYNVNFTSLTRNQANFDAITQTALNGGTCAQTADPAIKNSANCVLRGIPGTYSRFSAETHWRASYHRFIWSGVHTLRVAARRRRLYADQFRPRRGELHRHRQQRSGARHADGGRRIPLSVHQRGVLGHADPGTDRPGDCAAERNPDRQMAERGRAKPHLRRQQPVPRRQVLRLGPRRGRRPRQLRRAIYGAIQQRRLRQRSVRPVLQPVRAELIRRHGAANAGLDSGLDTTRSDYVARVSYQPNSTFTFTSRFRFDNDSFALRRTELGASANFDRWSTSLLYGDYDAQPDIGFLTRRQGLLGSGSFKLDANWVLLGGLRYDLVAKAIQQTQIGVGYVDDCLILSLNYITNYVYSGNPTADHRSCCN